MRGFWSGLKFGLQGLLAKELRSRSRGWRSMLLITGYLGALTLGIVGYLNLSLPKGEPLSPMVGQQYFGILGTCFVILLAMVTPALTTASISGERERKTLDLLLITQASPLGVIAGKWLGSVLYVIYLLLASLPAFALVYAYGGVPIQSLLLVLWVAAVTSLTYSALGLLLSALLKRTGVAALFTYLLVFFLVFGLPFLNLVQRSANQYGGRYPPMPPSTPVYSYVSPLSAVTSVLPSGPYGTANPIQMLLRRVGGYWYEEISAVPVGFAKVQVQRAFDPQTGQPQYQESWAPWVIYTTLSGAITLLSLSLSTLAIAPVKPGQGWRLRRRNRRLVQTTPVEPFS